MEKSIKRFLFLFSVSLLLFGCINENDIPGIYINSVKHSRNIDTLKIYKNGTYERFIYDKESEKLIFTDTKTWRLTESGLSLKGFLENDGGFSLENIEDNYDDYLITYFFHLQRRIDGLCLIYGENMDNFFIKQ